MRMRLHGRCLSDSLNARTFSEVVRRFRTVSPMSPSLVRTTSCTLASTAAGVVERTFQFGEVLRERVANCVDGVVHVRDRPVHVRDDRFDRNDDRVRVFRQLGDLIGDLRDLGRLPAPTAC